MLNCYYSEKVLGLQGVEIKNIENTEKEIYIEVELKRRPHRCPACGQETDRIHDYRRQSVKDIPAYGKAVFLLLRKRRYVCPCGKRFFEENTFLSRYQRMTARKIAYAISSLRKCRSYTSVSEEHGVSVSTILRLFNHVRYPRPKHLPVALGIDEFKGNSGGEKFHCILTDLETGTVIDILKTRYKHELYDYFKKYSREERSKVRYFVSDMYKTYADVAKTWFPDAVHIIDKYHWVRQMSFAFERVRKAVQKKFSKTHRIYFKHSRKLLLKRWKDLQDEQKQQVNVMLYASAELSTAYRNAQKLDRGRSRQRNYTLRQMRLYIQTLVLAHRAVIQVPIYKRFHRGLQQQDQGAKAQCLRPAKLRTLPLQDPLHLSIAVLCTAYAEKGSEKLHFATLRFVFHCLLFFILSLFVFLYPNY